MQILCKLTSPTGGSCLQNQRGTLTSKITTDFIFYQFFWKWSQDDAKEISFQGTSIKTYLNA